MNQTFFTHGAKGMYATYDLGLATALVTLNYPLIRLDKRDQKRVCFIFKGRKNLDSNVNHYWGNTLNLPVRAFFDNQKMLKSRIHSI